jgi:peptidoglycan-associated lipoprotein
MTTVFLFLTILFSSVSEASKTPPRDRIIHFIADDSLVPDAKSKRILKNHARYFAYAPTSYYIQLEGHTDERNGREYNIGISDEESNSVKHELIKLGVSPKRIINIGLGEEFPICKKHNHKCWKINRRVEIFYKREDND